MLTLLEVSDKGEGVVTLHLPIVPLKRTLCCSLYRDSNPVPTSPLADDLTTAPSGGGWGGGGGVVKTYDKLFYTRTTVGLREGVSA